MKKFCSFILFIFMVGPITIAQSANEISAVRKYSKQHAGNIIGEFVKFLAIPNVASDSANIQRNAAYIMGMMKKRGIEKVQLLHGAKKADPPAVYGEVNVPGAKQTLIFYAHYDGQPVNPAQWAKGLDPFEPKLFSNDFDKGGKNIPFPADNTF